MTPKGPSIIVPEVHSEISVTLQYLMKQGRGKRWNIGKETKSDKMIKRRTRRGKEIMKNR
jgi:hypothetical protein